MGISKAKEALGGQYAGSVIRFFENLMSSDFDYIVLLSRRCFVLYRIFSRLLGEAGKPAGSQPRIITDKAVALLSPSEELRGATCLIVDDILIHGRAVSRVYDALENIFGQLRVYVCGKSMDCYKGLPEETAEKLVAHTFSERIETASSWKLLSERLVSLIHLYDEPYTSFLMSMRAYRSPDVAAFASKLKAGVPGWEQHQCYHDQEEAADSVVLFEGQIPGFFSKYCEQACVRVYCRPHTGSLCITPTAFPRTLPARELDIFLQALTRDLPDSMDAVKNLLSLRDNDTKPSKDLQPVNDLRYRLAAAVLSALYGACALPSLCRAGLDIPELEADLAPLEYSFSPEVAECVQVQLNKDNRWTYAQAGAFAEPLDAVSYQETPELVGGLQSCLKARHGGGQETWKSFLEYFFLNGIKDERAVRRPSHNCRDVQRDIGLSTPNMMTIAQNMGLSKNAACANLISAWDTGRASMDALMYRTKDGQGYYSTFNCAGERSYRTVNEYLGYHIANMQRIEDVLLFWYAMQKPSCGCSRTYRSSLGQALKDYCEQAQSQFSWTAAVQEAVWQFINFLISEKVSVSDYALDSRDDTGSHQEIAEFGAQFIEQLVEDQIIEQKS